MNEQEIQEYIERFLKGTDQLSGAASTVQGRLLQLARSAGAAALSEDQNTAAKQRAVAAADGIVGGFKRLADTAGSVIMSMTTVPSAVASSNDAFTAVKPIVSLAANTLSGIVGAGTEVINSFTKFMPIIGGVTKAFGTLAQGTIRLVEGAINFQLEQTQQLVNNFNSLAKAGFVFGASLEQAKAAASAGGIALSTFTNIVSGQASNLALLGGNTEQAATRVVSAGNLMSGGLRTIFGGFEGLNTELIDTIALQESLGIRQSRNVTTLAKSTEPYLLNLKEISLLTGKSTQQIRDEMRQRAQSAAFQNAMADATSNAQTNLTSAFSQLTPQARAYAEELFAAQAVGADITSKNNLRLQAVAGPLTDKIRELVALKDLPPEEFKKRQAQLLQDVGQAGKALQKEYGYELFLSSVGRSPELFNQLNTVLSEITTAGSRYSDAIKAAAAAAASLAGIQGKFTNNIDDINRELQKLKSGLEQTGIEGFKDTANIVKYSLDAARALSTGLDKLSELIRKFVPEYEREQQRATESQRSQTEGEPGTASGPVQNRSGAGAGAGTTQSVNQGPVETRQNDAQFNQQVALLNDMNRHLQQISRNTA